MEETFDNVLFPDRSVPAWDVPDLRSKATARVVDAGVSIPNINDEVSNSTLDIRAEAYETGQVLSHYRPRSVTY